MMLLDGDEVDRKKKGKEEKSSGNSKEIIFLDSNPFYLIYVRTYLVMYIHLGAVLYIHNNCIRCCQSDLHCAILSYKYHRS